MAGEKCLRPVFIGFGPFFLAKSPSAELMAPLLHLLLQADRELGQQMKLIGNFERIACVETSFVSYGYHPLVRGAKL